MIGTIEPDARRGGVGYEFPRKSPERGEDGGAVGLINDSRLLLEIFDECKDCEH